MFGYKLSTLEDFVGLIKVQNVNLVFEDLEFRETAKEPRAVASIIHITAGTDNYYICSLPLVSKQVNTPEDEQAFIKETEAEQKKIEAILRTNAPGILQMSGSIWPIK